MQAIGARLDGRVHHRTGGASQFGAEVRGLHLEFLNRVDRRKDDEVGAVQEVHGVRVVVDAIEQVVILRRAETVRREGARRGIAAGVSLRRLHAGAKLGKEGEIAAVQGKVIHLLLADHLADRCFLGLQQRRRRVHFNGFRRRAQLERNVHLQNLRDLDLDVLLGRLREAFGSHGD